MKLKAFILTICLVTLSIPTPLFAAKGARKEGKAARGAHPGMLIKRYDTDKNGTIDGTEAEALRKAFDNDPFRKLDANNDGKLDDTEIASIKARHGKGEAGKRRKKNV